MPLLASSVVVQARELDPGFTPQRHPQGTVLRALARIQRRLIAELAKIDRRQVTSTLEITLPLADFAAGAALEEAGQAIEVSRLHLPLDMYVEGLTLPRPLDLIDWSDRHRTPFDRVAWIRGTRLYLSMEAADWTEVERIVVTYTPTPESVAITDELVLPITAEEVLVQHLAGFMASRSKDEELARARGEYLNAAAQAEALWLAEIRQRIPATVSRTREVW